MSVLKCAVCQEELVGHMCDECGRFFCYDCAETQIQIFGNGSDDIEYVCNECMEVKHEQL